MSGFNINGDYNANRSSRPFIKYVSVFGIQSYLISLGSSFETLHLLLKYFRKQFVELVNSHEYSTCVSSLVATLSAT